MKKQLYTLLSVLSLSFLLGACSDESLNPSGQEADTFQLPAQLTVTMSSPKTTRTTYSESESVLKTAWKNGDRISITPSCRYAYSTLYTIDDSSIKEGAAATFNLTSGGEYNTSNVNTNTWGVYYPGDKVKSDIDFMNFSYEGQVQKASDPMAHLAEYHAMRYLIKESSNTTFSAKEVDFSESDQSSCMKLCLGGMTFQNPTHVSISVCSNGFRKSIFYNNNTLNSYYYDGNSSYNGIQTTDELGMDLEGYGNVDELIAYLMMSNQSVTLPANSYVLVCVTCSDATYCTQVQVGTSNYELTGGYCHKITAMSGWSVVPDMDDNTYSYDGDVVTLQKATVGNGIDVVIMGDGFTASDFEEGGSSKYTSIMKQACEDFFSVEPLKHFQDYFNVYYVKAVSPQDFGDATILANGAIGAGTKTKFSVNFSQNSTNVTGNDDLVRTYAKKAFDTNANERIQNATIIVMCNLACHAGTCCNTWSTINYDYGQGCAVVYCPLGKSISNETSGRAPIIHHEACGHGFGKLLDEYSGNTYPSYPENYWKNTIEYYHSFGYGRNVDKYVKSSTVTSAYPDITTTGNVYWNDLFNTENNYESESVEALGVFEGADTYIYHACRPTYNGNKSIMNQNTGQFNAISRRQIIYRILSLAGVYNGNIWGTNEELNYFLSWDKEYYLGSAAAAELSKDASTRGCAYEEDIMPLAPPVLQEGNWVDGHFIPKE